MSESLKKVILMNIGIFGAGEWGKNHVRVFSELLGPESVTVADVYEENLKLVREKFNVNTCTDYMEILRDPKIEAVVVCTPSSLHYKICKESLQCGKDVFCEKPLSSNSLLCRDLIKIAENEHRTLMVGHIFRFNSLTTKVKEMIELGTLGEIFFMQSDRIGLRTPRSDCGVTFDFAIHDVDMACYLANFDYPEEVTANMGSYLPHRSDDFGAITLKFANYILTHIVVSWLTPHKVRNLTVVGRDKSVFVDFLNSKMLIYDIGITPRYNSYNQFKLITRQGPTQEVNIENNEPLKEEDKHFLDCVKNGKHPITDGIVGLRAVEIVEAAYQSAKEQRTVKMKNVS